MSQSPQSATFAGISILCADNVVCSGAAFELADAARQSEVVAVDGWEAEVLEGQRVIVVRGGSEESHDDAFRVGLATAQRALDLMCIRGSNNLMIKAYDDEYLTWWPEAGELVIRIVSFAHVNIDVGAASLTVTDATGNVIPPPPIPPVSWHESFRYFRLSQTTDDLFDAYRNAYLALESVLSSIAPQRTNAAGKVTEREGSWLKRALAQANRITPLTSFAPVGTSDPLAQLFDDLYINMRSAMSHAKSGRKVLLPQDYAERANVLASLRRLVGLYLRLAEVHLGAKRLGGFMFAAGFRLIMSPPLERMELVVSDDESPFDKSETSPNPAGGAIENLRTAEDVDTSQSFVVTRVWSAPCTDLSDLRFIRRIIGNDDDTLRIVAVLKGRLTLGSAERLEVMLGLMGSNTRQPRDGYSY